MQRLVTALAARYAGWLRRIGRAAHGLQPWWPICKPAGPHALVHAGPDLPAEAHALVHQINERLGGRGTTFGFIEPVAASGDETDGMAALMDDMQAGRVETLLILDGNPVYAAKGFREALARVRFSLSAPRRRTKRAGTRPGIYRRPTCSRPGVMRAPMTARSRPATSGAAALWWPKCSGSIGPVRRRLRRRCGGATRCGRPGATSWTSRVAECTCQASSGNRTARCNISPGQLAAMPAAPPPRWS